jgi:hypothetical protein
MFRGALAGVLLLASVVHAEAVGQNPGGHSSAQQNHTNPKQADYEGALAAVQGALKSIAAALVAIENERPSAEEKDQGRRNLQAQENLAFWARLMFFVAVVEIVVTVIGVFVVWLTLNETRRNGQAQVRAYLACSAATYLVEEPETFILRPEFKNTGQSPANSVWVTARLEVFDGEKSYLFGADGSIPSIASDHTAVGELMFEKATPYACDCIMQDYFVRILGSVYWKDVFGKTNTIRFALDKRLPGDTSVRNGARTYVGPLDAVNRASWDAYPEAEKPEELVKAREG